MFNEIGSSAPLLTKTPAILILYDKFTRGSLHIFILLIAPHVRVACGIKTLHIIRVRQNNASCFSSIEEYTSFLDMFNQSVSVSNCSPVLSDPFVKTTSESFKGVEMAQMKYRIDKQHHLSSKPFLLKMTTNPSANIKKRKSRCGSHCNREKPSYLNSNDL
ncbi:hypothetical protein BpHYR1_016963 [Brachionus plicatilis]|uniref:Uncharacterized protein n=1 Tax=Brachionus plicatilis TaxID=10195 RepID=A0A3M7QJH2_BRAPC|nr:hypothetical protein BpHYR1_016963 [Brachionus plicatilis]